MKAAKRMVANTMLLSVVSLVMRGIGVSFNVYLTQRLGAATLGLFGLLMSVYSFCITLSCSGVRLATTRLTTEAMSRGQSPKVPFMFCLLWGLTAGSIVGAGLFLLSDFAAVRGLNYIGASAAFKILAIGLPPLAVSSAMRGFFLSKRQIGRQSAVDMFELIAQVIITVAALETAIPQDSADGLKAIAIGACISEYMSLMLAYMVGQKSSAELYRSGGRVPLSHTVAQFMRIVIPIAASALLCSMLRTSEQLLIPVSLRKSGLDTESALASLGTVSGMVLPVLYFPSAILTAFSSLLVPELTEAFVRGYKLTIKRVASRSIAVTILFSIGVSAISFAFAPDLSQAIYQNQDTAFFMRVFAPLIPLVYLDFVVDGMLKGLDEQFNQMLYSVLDAGLSVLLVWLLIPKWALMGYVATIFIAKSANAILSLIRLVSVARLEIDILRTVILPMLSVLAAIKICSVVPLAQNIAGLAVKFGACGLIYLCLLFVLGCMPFEWARLR